jgi:hypothetical protein
LTTAGLDPGRAPLLVACVGDEQVIDIDIHVYRVIRAIDDIDEVHKAAYPERRFRLSQDL